MAQAKTLLLAQFGYINNHEASEHMISVSAATARFVQVLLIMLSKQNFSCFNSAFFRRFSNEYHFVAIIESIETLQ